MRTGEQPSTPVLTGPTSINSTMRPVVTWNSVLGADRYEVRIDNLSNGQINIVDSVATGTSLTPQIDLGIGKFVVWVRAFSSGGGLASLWSLPRYFQVKAPIVQVVTRTNASNGLTEVSWQALPGAVKYDVWIDRLDVPTAQIFRNTNISGLSVTPTSLPNGGRYRVWVRGLAADGYDGAWSLAQDFVETQVPAIT
ncbi:MAG: hypothetical protein WKF77_32130, partial [Planctomycetaceae bacterium]